jgi:UDP-N-acetylglucosamine--N-acetylmuramyl-(pentapeptide) pyrophosphoryl-undecaprenol N-acetylglucosamine transferase
MNLDLLHADCASLRIIVGFNMRVLIMAGGTGGHVFPALAIARKLQSNGYEVVWLGTQKGLEAEKVPAAGFPIFYLSIAGFRGKSGGHKIKVAWSMLKAVYQALQIIRQIRPDVVLGMGGFASGPGGFAAWLLRKPLVIHEQNAVAGLTNRLLSHLSKRVLTAFPNVLANATVVGNPVHEKIAALPIPKERFAERIGKIRLLILGGSLGAHAINTIVPQAISLMADCPLIRHQTGEKHLAETEAAYKTANVEAVIEPFIEDMASAYGDADLVICRAGALTVSELAAAGVGSILIPYPHAVDDHQTKNGAYLVQAGAAVLIPQADLTPQRLADMIATLACDRDNLLKMAETARWQRKIDPTEQVIQCCKEVLQGSKSV